jgi:membrane-bound metal-dependent hydrolase YbcI (DUF457 family)
MTHILLDSLNKSAMKVFWPISNADIAFYVMSVDDNSAWYAVYVPLLLIYAYVIYYFFGLTVYAYMPVLVFFIVITIITITAKRIYMFIALAFTLILMYYFVPTIYYLILNKFLYIIDFSRFIR